MECVCGNLWKARQSRFNKRTNCPACKPKRSFKHKKPNDIINGHTLLEKTKNGKWKVKCKCGSLRYCQPIDLQRYDSCFKCYDPDIVHSQTRLHPYERAARRKLRIYKRGAKQRDLKWEITDQDARRLFADNCAYCNAEGIPLNGIDRVDNSIGYQLENLLSCCSFCNHAKKHTVKKLF